MLRYIKLSMLIAALFCFSQSGQASAAGQEAFSDERINVQQAPAKPSSDGSASQADRNGKYEGRDRPSTRPERPDKEGSAVNNEKPDNQGPRWSGQKFTEPKRSAVSPNSRRYGDLRGAFINSPEPRRRPNRGHYTRPDKEHGYYGYGYYGYDCQDNQDCPTNDPGATVNYDDGDVYIQSEPRTYFQGSGRFERFSDPRDDDRSFSISLPDNDASKDDFDRYQIMINSWQ